MNHRRFVEGKLGEDIEKNIKKVCPNCFKTFYSKYRRRKYCSFNCSFEARRAQNMQRIPLIPKQNKNCVLCGDNFVARNKNQRFCSQKCALKRYEPKKVTKVCITCGVEFQTSFKWQSFCSLKCSQERRKLSKSSIIQDIREFIFERDNFVCQYCQNRFPFDKLNAHHVIPVSKGGADTKENIKTACEECHYELHKGDFNESH